MASTSKAFEIVCGSVSSLFDTRWHTRSLRLLFGRRARTRCLWGGNLRALWESSVLVCPSFRGKRGQPSASRDSIPTAAEARRRLKSRGSQLDMADELEKDRPFSRASAENESELLDCDDAIFLTSSDSAVSALLGYAQEEQEMFEGEEVETWTLSILLHCIWMSFWRLWIIKINLSGHKSQLERAFLSS